MDCGQGINKRVERSRALLMDALLDLMQPTLQQNLSRTNL